MPKVKNLKKKRSTGTQRYRNVFFTLFPWKEENMERCPLTFHKDDEYKNRLLSNLGTLPDKWRFLILVKHKCPKTGREHYHGYVEFKTNVKMRLASIKQAISPQIHVEQARKQADVLGYIRDKDKDGYLEGPWQTGEKKNPGFRSELVGTANQIYHEIQQGNSMEDIEDTHGGYVMLHRNKIAAEWCKQNVPLYRHPSEFQILIFWGDTGSGKSHTALNKYGRVHLALIPTKLGDKPWIEGYTGEETSVYNEFGDGGTFTYTTIKAILDLAAWHGQSKGASTLYNPARIIITTCVHPKRWFPNIENKSELKRRFRQFGTLYHFTKKRDEPVMLDPATNEPIFPHTINDMKEFRFEEESYDFSAN